MGEDHQTFISEVDLFLLFMVDLGWDPSDFVFRGGSRSLSSSEPSLADQIST